MRRFLVSGLFVWVSALVAQAAQAAPIGYDCTLNPKVKNGLLSPGLFIAHDPATGRVLVSDPMALHVNNGQPVAARMVSDGAKRDVFSWELKFTNRAQQKARLRYRATYFKADNRISVVVTPVGYSNRIMAKGTCKVGAVSKIHKR
ncbi:MAG: hypothetical protein N4A61_04550 [Pelagimonas sp.]|jgi:hypothetical protein|nr:hypothetical protein [Pelagimonas sp.]